MRLALCQINATVGDIAANADRILAALGSAREAGAELVLTPELAQVLAREDGRVHRRGLGVERRGHPGGRGGLRGARVAGDEDELEEHEQAHHDSRAGGFKSARWAAESEKSGTTCVTMKSLDPNCPVATITDSSSPAYPPNPQSPPHEPAFRNCRRPLTIRNPTRVMSCPP